MTIDSASLRADRRALRLARARAFALARDLDRALKLEYDPDPGLALELTLELARDLALNLDRNFDRNLKRTLELGLAHELDRDLALARARAVELDRALDRATDCALDPAFNHGNAVDVNGVAGTFVVDLYKVRVQVRSVLDRLRFISFGQSESGEESLSTVVHRLSEMSCRVTVWAAGLLPAGDRDTYAEVFRSELHELADAGARWWPQLRCALRVLVRAPSLRRALRAPAPATRERSW